MAGTSFQRRQKKFSKKMQRTLDPAMLLSRGLSARFIGANVMQSITPLSKEEIEKDLRHMNAYYQANVAYAQHHYIFMNREELGAQGQLPGIASGGGGSNGAAATGAAVGAFHGGVGFAGAAAGGTAAGATVNRTENIMVPPIAMPVRIDPEEEKRLQNLRKKIALCETQREFLESQYVSLRAHYVATTKELAAASKNNEALVVFLQAVTKRRGKVLALQRARLQIARDVLVALHARLECLEEAAIQQSQQQQQENQASAGGVTKENSKVDEATKMDVDSPKKSTVIGISYRISGGQDGTKQQKQGDDDIVQVWNDIEEMLKEAEVACRNVPSTLTLNEKKKGKKPKKSALSQEVEEELSTGVIPWDAIKMPITPHGVPLYLSQLTVVPDKGAAFGTAGVFGSNKSSMCWMESNMPQSYNSEEENLKVAKLRDEVKLLEEELEKERSSNRDIQLGIIDRRKRSDELVAMMTLLRGETEAILQRHNILLDSPEAKDAARELHEELLRTRAKVAASASTTAVNGGGGAAAVAGVEGGATTNTSGAGDKTAPTAETNTGGVGGGGSKKSSPVGKDKVRSPKDDDENDGDDEGELDEDEDEDGEIVENKSSSSSKNNSSKRNLDEEDDSPGRKRRKLYS